MRVCIVTYDEYINIPYIEKYEKCLREASISYDIILWDRRNMHPELQQEDNKYFFHANTGKSKFSKIIPFWQWRIFVLNILKKNKYDKLIILTTIPGVLIFDYILLKYKHKYILDIRDFTYENWNLYKVIVDRLVSDSFATLISSAGFRTWLTPNKKIVENHNISNTKEAFKECNFMKGSICIGFVGGIRFFEENKKIIRQFANQEGIVLKYIGKRHPGEDLESFCRENGIRNVLFRDAFNNNQKPQIYEEIDFINSIYGSGSKIVRTALPNKLYDCILFKKPIIVSKHTYLESIVLKYGLGFSVDLETDDIKYELDNYISNFEKEKFVLSCNMLLEKIIRQEKSAIKKIRDFIK